MVVASALALAAMQVSPPHSVTPGYICLMAGPSRSLLVVSLGRASQAFVLQRVTGQVWPFAADRITLSPRQGGYGAQGTDTGSGLSVLLTPSFENDELSVTISRGGWSPEGLPVLAGACAASGSRASSNFLVLVRNTAFAPPQTATAFRTGRLVASANCQVVSTAGWVSRFSIAFQRDSAAITIRPADQHLWRAATIDSQFRGAPFPEPRGWLYRGYDLGPGGRPDRGSPYNTIWVSTTPDGQQSSAHASFIGHRSGDSAPSEQVGGICTDFAGEGTPS
jgi:hypothetical protein